AGACRGSMGDGEWAGSRTGSSARGCSRPRARPDSIHCLPSPLRAHTLYALDSDVRCAADFGNCWSLVKWPSPALRTRSLLRLRKSVATRVCCNLQEVLMRRSRRLHPINFLSLAAVGLIALVTL